MYNIQVVYEQKSKSQDQHMHKNSEVNIIYFTQSETNIYTTKIGNANRRLALRIKNLNDSESLKTDKFLDSRTTTG